MALVLLEIAAQRAAHAGSERGQPALAELRLADVQVLTFEIEVPAAKPRDLAHPQSEPVHQGEDHPVGRSPMGCKGSVAQIGGTDEKPLDLRGLEQKWSRMLSGATWRQRVRRRGGHHALRNQPTEQSLHDVEQMVMAARSRARSGPQKGLEQPWRDLRDRIHVALVHETVEQAQSAFLGVEALAQGSMMGQETLDVCSQGALERVRRSEDAREWPG